MLYKVEIENFYSIGERQVIDLRARKSVQDDQGRLSPLYEGSDERVPNVVTLFGSNASGKSNVLRAIIFGLRFVVNSFFEGHSNLQMPYEKFSSAKRIAKPSRLVLSFSGPADFRDTSGEGPQCPYTYQLVLSPRRAKKTMVIDHVVLEKLSYQPKGHGKPTTIFERKEGGAIRYTRGFMTVSMEKALRAVLRDNASVISTLAQLNHDIAKMYTDFAGSVQSNIFIDRIQHDEERMTQWYANDPEALTELQDVVKRIDLGIEKVGLDKSAPSPRLQFRHSGLDLDVFLNRESTGTRRCVEILPYIISVLDTGSIAIMDELDVAIHPVLLPEILRWFGSSERNPRGAQLWMTCHLASLLRNLTKEEVFFCEKDAQGCTSVYGLADIEGVRRDEDFMNKYLNGEYGAVPTIG